MKNAFEVPVIPNAPLASPDHPDPMGSMLLKENHSLGLTVNSKFDENIIDYNASYQNDQSLSPIFKTHMQNVVSILKSSFSKTTRIVEVGCGKGEFLELLDENGYFNISGYDATYEGLNPKIRRRYLTQIDKISADLVILRHVLEHIPNPHAFLQMLNNIFGNAKIYIEVPEYSWILKNGTFFDITYEHVNYYTEKGLSRHFTEVDRKDVIFDNQYQYVIASLNNLDNLTYPRAYSAQEKWVARDLESLFPVLSVAMNRVDNFSRGKKLLLWGGATKGVLFAHHAKSISQSVFDRISYCIDINPAKQGKFFPATHIPIYGPQKLSDEEANNICILVMNPNYLEEIRLFLNSNGLAEISLMAI